MTPQEIRDAVAADPALSALGTDYAAAHQIATTLSAGRKRLSERLITERGVVSLLGPVDGDAFLTGIETFCSTTLPAQHPLKAAQPGIRRVVSWLKPGAEGVDIGNPLTHQMLDTLVASGDLNAAHVAAVKAAGYVDDPVPTDAVYQALQGATE